MIPLRLVIDTNVIVSAALRPTVCSAPSSCWPSANRLGSMSPTPFSRNTGKSYGGRSSRSAKDSAGRSLVISSGRDGVTDDDNIFLECADAARADYLITGNQRHFPRFWMKTKVITSREFISVVAPHLIP
jgi:predicted nucleic acid-binding protein